jgi:hypothetical protein
MRRHVQSLAIAFRGFKARGTFKIVGHGSKSANKIISLEEPGKGFIQKRFWTSTLAARLSPPAS